MADAPDSSADVSPADKARAEKLFTNARQRADLGQHDYGVELYLQGLAAYPSDIEAHKSLRELSLQRKHKGGKPLGMMAKAKLSKGKTSIENLLYNEKLLAYDPGNDQYMLGVFKAAVEAELPGVVLWMGPILFKLNADGKQSFSTFTTLKDGYKQIGAYRQAIDAGEWAKQLKPTDNDLAHELKELAARLAMSEGKYGGAGGFTESLANRDQQTELLRQDADIRTAEGMAPAIAAAKKAYEADPTEGKLFAYVEALTKVGEREYEEAAIAELEKAFKESDNFRFRRRALEVELRQMSRMADQLRRAAEDDKDDPDKKQDYEDYRKMRYGRELEAHQEVAKHYPNDLAVRFQIGKTLFQMGEYDDAIPSFQQSQQDPKFRSDSRLLLGRSFLHSGFTEEAVGTLRALLEDYELNDDKSKDMKYWFGRSLEEAGENEEASKAYSQVAQSDFNYRDVRNRLKELRTKKSDD